MKIWTGFGSEHSYRLVLIGHFADERDARAVEEKFELIREVASDEFGALDWDDASPGYSVELYNRLQELKVWNLSRTEVEGFGYLEGISREGATITLHTDDAELQGFLKLLFDHGARVEIYSTHHWTDAGEPREPEPERIDARADGAEVGADGGASPGGDAEGAEAP
jgi:hypothetical protein